MGTTVLRLISDAYYVTGIVAKEFEQVNPSQYDAGIRLLNEILTDKTIEQSMIPSYSVRKDFEAVIGQEMYFIPDMTRLDVLTFFIQDVRYSMVELDRAEYFGTSRANNILSLPYCWHQERTKGGTNIYMYFSPQENYIMQASGLYSVPLVSFNQDVESIYDAFFVSYLKYRLSQKLCIVYNITLPDAAKLELDRYEKQIRKRSAVIDVKMKKISTLDLQGSLNYAQINIGDGKVPV